ncbi:sulfite exporter TauE/SafE family protein [Cytobacillus oceanisediminis]|uniref:Probable membrane transporter protein n=1 Tax=Cytobacillus oceanisediminis 2691 TaxID=1196031 RepID=A0A160MB38_9BACI|nr:sulfite exporter TauE/SafE family protein [Cytobacillus oceanisediminis]AND39804.1 hypothetical protein A361_11855 [Cytobacillus oceanisediminis 2691]MCM3394422.1 sulfite exporter TauE/SafE family protein [Cytobacillus oceanisediminis]
MRKLLTVTFVGFIAQLIDGSLGMAYGVTSSSLLLMLGMAPAVASASIHISEVVTTAASGFFHFKFGNVDRGTVMKLILPGGVGAFIGACFLSSMPGEAVRPFISVFLLLLGVYILFRFLFLNSTPNENKGIQLSNRKAAILGLLGGFADATGGGGWGPITTPVLLAQKDTAPRKVIGTVDTSEFVIALSATAGFLISLGWKEFDWFWVLALMLGGLFAAPIAAWLVRILPSYLLGVAVGGVIIITNLHTIINLSGIGITLSYFIYPCLFMLWIIAIIYTIKKNKS